MISEPPQPQEPGSPASCPKNSFGQSWNAFVLLEERVQQRCRFCHQTRESLLPSRSKGECSGT